MPEIFRILNSASAGDPKAAAELLPLVYDELRRLAAARIAMESASLTLQPTALVHEAYIRLVGTSDTIQWQNRGHFFAAAAEAMRRILIESARRKLGPTHGGHLSRKVIDYEIPAELGRSDQILHINEALDRLATIDARAAEVVKLRFFAGLTVSEVALALDISPRTVDSDWAYARAWLITAIQEE